MAQGTGVAAPQNPVVGTTASGVGITASQAAGAASYNLNLAGRTHFADEPWLPASEIAQTTHDDHGGQIRDA